MNSKMKLIVGIGAFVILIGGSALLYQSLSKNYKPGNNLTGGDSANSVSDKASLTDESESGEPKAMLAPDFSVVDENGSTVKLSDFIGKPVVVNFWASWCPPCKEEMPEFNEAFLEMGEDIVFMMINATDGGRETEETAKKYLASKDYSFSVYYDTSQEASYTYGVSSLPTTLFIDAEGYLVTGAIGMIDEATLRKGISMIKSEESAVNETGKYQKISAKEAKKMIERKEDYILLDVRTQEEYEESRIEGSILIPDTEIKSRAEKELSDKHAAILVYCRSGRRSAAAAKELLSLGYTNVYDFGGIIDWPYDTVK